MKPIILLMSCNSDLYREEELACRETFLKDAEDLGVPYWFYKGLDASHSSQTIDCEEHTMYLDVDDGLSGTGRKTVGAMKAALAYEWDYLVKTNVSTYINIPNVLRAMEGWEGREDLNIYGGRWIVNEHSKHIPFPRGFFAIYSRRVVEGMLPYMETLSRSTDMPRTDDTLICLSGLYWYNKVLGEDYAGHMMEVPAWHQWERDTFVPMDLALAVRCKDEKEPGMTPGNMREVKAMMGDRGIPTRMPMGVMETGFGMMTWPNYNALRKLMEAIKALK